jgi:Uma2 family endonuclease
MIVSTDRRMTLDQYLAYTHDSDARYELVDGVVTEMAPENPENNTIAVALLVHFAMMGIPAQLLATAHQVEVTSTYVTARQPDLTVHTKESRQALKVDGSLLQLGQPNPALVVEVVSSSDTDWASKNRDYVLKRDEYEARGIPEYWLADPIAGLVIVFSLVDGVYHAAEFRGTQLITSPGFPSLKLTAERLLSADFED